MSSARPRRSLARRVFLWLLTLSVIGAAVGGAVAWWQLERIRSELPSIFAYEDYSGIADQESVVLAADGAPIAVFAKERRVVVPRESMPVVLSLAAVAAEDADFYTHPGIDFVGIARAMWKNVRAGRFKQGASTITQQVARTFYLSHEKTVRRKIREAILAVELERRLSKEELLTLYLNQIYFGHGRYGVEAASRFYFGRGVSELGLAEAALLAGVVNSPERLSPYKHPERARSRRAYVLDQMVAKGFVDAERGKAAAEAPLGVLDAPPATPREARWFVDAVRRRVEAVVGRGSLRTGGLIVETTLDRRTQRAADEAIARGLARIDVGGRVWKRERHFDESAGATRFLADWLHERKGSLRPGRIVPVVVDGDGDDRGWRVRTPWGRAWLSRAHAQARLERASAFEAESSTKKKKGKKKDKAKKRVPARLGFGEGDLLRASATGRDDSETGLPIVQPELGPQAAVVVIEPTTRKVRALVGGDDIKTHPFNRALQARRQAGSSFKPVVYAAAVEAGVVDERSVFHNTPETYRLPGGRKWTPRNFSGKYDGRPLSLADALAGSVNVVAVQVLSRVGLKKVIAMTRALGLRGDVAQNLTVALGSVEVTPLELTNAMATFAADGRYAEPVLIERVRAADGRVIDVEAELRARRCAEADPPCADPGQALSPQTAHTMIRLMHEVTRRGTARRLRKSGRQMAGKTGTTNGARSLWFAGTTPELTAAVFVGFDDQRRIAKGTAGRYAVPIWKDLFERALEGTAASSFGPWMGPRPPRADDLVEPPAPDEASWPTPDPPIDAVGRTGPAPPPDLDFGGGGPR